MQQYLDVKVKMYVSKYTEGKYKFLWLQPHEFLCQLYNDSHVQCLANNFLSRDYFRAKFLYFSILVHKIVQVTV